MKLVSISNRETIIDNLLQERITGHTATGFDVFQNVNDGGIEKSYQQIEILQAALATGNFGVFINKSPDQLRESDITPIKNAILEMLINNKFFENMNFKSGNGAQNLALLGHALGHAIEFTLLTALTALLGGVAGEEAIHGDLVLAALSGAGAVATGYGIHKQIQTIRALWAAYKLYRIINSFENYTNYNPKTYQRTLIGAFLDWVEGKTPQQIRQAIIQKVQIESQRKQMQFQKEIRNLPKFIVVHGNNGGDVRVPIVTFFDYH